MFKKTLLSAIKFYQLFFSPDQGIFLRRRTCRFFPTCSQYAYDAIDARGVLEGSWLAIKRISRCHPFCKGGFDPAPEPNSKSEILYSKQYQITKIPNLKRVLKI